MGQRMSREWADAKEAAVELKDYMRVAAKKRKAKGLQMKKNWWKYLLVILAIAGTVLLSIYHKKIVAMFEPHKDAIVNFPASWAFPIIILVIISFPPLAGHEIVLLVVGLIWGLWVGFAIAAAGTFIGELLCYWAFKYWATSYARRIEEKQIMYACLARLMREGGLGIVILVRFSVLPGHIVTAIQSTVGMPLWIYCVAVFVSLPKQLVVVYLGVLFGTTGQNADRERKISLTVFFLTALMTIIAAYVVYMRARKLYPAVLAEHEARKLSKLGDNERVAYLRQNHDFGSTTEIPLTAEPAETGMGGQDGQGRGRVYGGMASGSAGGRGGYNDPFADERAYQPNPYQHEYQQSRQLYSYPSQCPNQQPQLYAPSHPQQQNAQGAYQASSTPYDHRYNHNSSHPPTRTEGGNQGLPTYMPDQYRVKDGDGRFVPLDAESDVGMGMRDARSGGGFEVDQYGAPVRR